MANKNKKGAPEAPKKSIGFSTKKRSVAAPVAAPERERLTRKQIVILISVMLVAVMISGAIIGAVISIKKADDPDFMKARLSRYISISEDGYTGYKIDIPLDEFSDSDLLRAINKLLCEHKTLNAYYNGKFAKSEPLSLGDAAYLYYRGYTVDENGREKDFAGSSNFTDDTPVILEVGTGNVLDNDGNVSGEFIAGFGEALTGIVPIEYTEFEKINSGRVMPGDVIYLSYTVSSDKRNEVVKNERIDLGLSYIDEVYGDGFTELFVGKSENGEVTGYKSIGEEIKSFIIKKKDNQLTDTVYSNMKIEFATRCEDSPKTVTLRFPANYAEESLRGVEAKFDVYVKYATIYDTATFDDKFVSETLKVSADELSGYAGESLADKYKAKLKAEGEEKTDESNYELLVEEMWKHLMDKVEIKKLPKKTVDFYYNSYYTLISNTYKSYSNEFADLDSFAVAYLNRTYGADLEDDGDWGAYITKLAEKDVVQKLLLYYIIREEGFLPSDEEYQGLYDKFYSEILDYYLDLHKEEFAEYSEEEYKTELEILKGEINSYYDDEYFSERIYYYYGTRKMLSLAEIAK